MSLAHRSSLKSIVNQQWLHADIETVARTLNYLLNVDVVLCFVFCKIKGDKAPKATSSSRGMGLVYKYIAKSIDIIYKRLY